MTEGTWAVGNTERAVQPREVREWAKSNGYNVAERGRLSKELREAFTAATGKAA